MSNSTSILQIKSKSYRWYGLGLFMVGCLLLLFYKNIFNVKTITYNAVSIFQGNMQYRKAQWGDAEIQYKKALETLPDSNNVLFNLGNAYYQQGRYSEALAVYLNLSDDKTNKSRLTTWMNLGRTYYKLGALEKSYEFYKKALLLDDSNVVVRQNFLFIANLLRKQKLKQTPSEKQKEAAKKGDEKKEEASDNKDGEKDNKKMQPGVYHFSDKEMNDMLRQTKDKVRVPQGTKSKKNHSITNPLDY
ncbi:tetratricopeptide repeat protein [Flavobacterium sp.]|uniref:tetratricopeptide repeat protein n=1 Tax=Flavobacterium sp. TaxID=239 RepID=UPI00286C5F24|nr:tetratricopeptide repeat protein [Flavobacterium sp.]